MVQAASLRTELVVNRKYKILKLSS